MTRLRTPKPEAKRTLGPGDRNTPGSWLGGDPGGPAGQNTGSGAGAGAGTRLRPDRTGGPAKVRARVCRCTGPAGAGAGRAKDGQGDGRSQTDPGLGGASQKGRAGIRAGAAGLVRGAHEAACGRARALLAREVWSAWARAGSRSRSEGALEGRRAEARPCRHGMETGSRPARTRKTRNRRSGAIRCAPVTGPPETDRRSGSHPKVGVCCPGGHGRARPVLGFGTPVTAHGLGRAGKEGLRRPGRARTGGVPAPCNGAFAPASTPSGAETVPQWRAKSAGDGAGRLQSRTVSPGRGIGRGSARVGWQRQGWTCRCRHRRSARRRRVMGPAPQGRIGHPEAAHEEAG